MFLPNALVGDAVVEAGAGVNTTLTGRGCKSGLPTPVPESHEHSTGPDLDHRPATCWLRDS